MLRSATAVAQLEMSFWRPPSARSSFVELVAKRLAFRPGELRRLNANERAILAAHLTEFHAAIGLINSINTLEREYHEFVPRSFDALRKVGRPWRGSRNRLSRVLNAA